MRRLLSVILFASALLAQTSNFPGSLDTDATLFIAKDNTQTTLSAPMLAGDGVANVQSTMGWAANMIAFICEGTVTSGGVCSGSFEEMLVTAVNGTTKVLTVTRGIGGTTGIAHAAGRFVTNAVTASYLTAAKAAIIAVETALGAGLSHIPASPSISTATYNFGPIVSGSGVSTGSTTIVPGNNTLTFSTVPLGVNGTDSAHYVYIQSGTGTAEACLINGGAGTSGETNGQIIVNCANNHSGLWSVSSASGGIAEVWQANVTTGATAVIPSNTFITLHQKLTAPTGSNFPFVVNGQGSASIVRGSDYLAGDLLYATGFATLFARDLYVSNTNGTSGCAIHSAGQSGTLYTDYVTISGGSCGVEADALGNWFANQTRFNTSQTCSAGWYIHGNGAGLETNNTVINGGAVATTLCSAIKMTGADIVQVVNTIIGGGGGTANTPTIALYAAAGDYISSPLFANTAVGPVTAGSNLVATSGKVIYAKFLGGDWDGGFGTLSCFDLGFTATVTTGTFDFDGVNISGCGGSALVIGPFSTGGEINLTGSHLADNNTAGGANSAQINIAPLTTGFPAIHIMASTVTNPGAAFTGAAQYGIRASGAVGTLEVTGNDLLGNSVAPFLAPTSSTKLLVANNLGIDEVTGTAASAATLTFPVNPSFNVTGSTNVTATAGCWAGRKGTLTATAATLTFTSGATIGNSFILAQNVPANYICDGTKVWLTGQSPTISNTYNYIASETGANNAIAGALTGVTLGAGLRVTVQLAHTLQAGANTFNLNAGGAVAIKSSRNVANNIGVAYAATGTVTLMYDGTEWVDVSQ